MKKLWLVCILAIELVFLSGCKNDNIQSGNLEWYINCTAEEKAADACNMIYSPVCWDDWETYWNSCVACSSQKINSYKMWECGCESESWICGIWDEEDSKNIEEEIVEEVEEEVIDWEKWNLLAFNWKEVDWNYDITITNDGKLYTKFCNSMWWDVVFDWDENEWTISTSLIQTQMACEWESMDLENAFQIDWASYTTIANEDWWKTMIITTLNWDKFNWRTN